MSGLMARWGYPFLNLCAASLILAGPAPMHGCSGTAIQGEQPLIIAHRGASGLLPEHTLAAYTGAYFQGADIIEPDVVATRDAELVCFHDLTLGDLTDVRERFPSRRRDDGRWYVIDFDLDELRNLEIVGRSGRWSGSRIPTLDEMLGLIRSLNERTGRRVGVIPEIKRPDFHADHGVDLPARTLGTLRAAGWSTDLVYIQCFDLVTIERLNTELRCEYPLIHLTSRTLGDRELYHIAHVADGIGPSRDAIESDPTLVPRAHSRGLIVFPYTFGDEPSAVREFVLDRGVDGVFVDFPGIARRALGDGTNRD